jgi:hypothetical protein
MSIRSVIFSAALAAGIMAHGAANAATVDVVLRSNSIDTSFQTVALQAGTWDINLLATFTGSGFISWNPWGNSTVGCVSDANCERGWLNDFRIRTSDGASVQANAPRVAYALPELARNNFKPFEFVLDEAGDVVFSISDGQTDEGQYANNLGGLSLRLTLRDAPAPPPPPPNTNPSVIPLPAGGVLLLSAFGLMGWASWRRRHTLAA